MCAEKIFDYLGEQDKRFASQRRGSEGGSQLPPRSINQEYQILNGVLTGILDGLRDAYADLQSSHMDLVT